MAWHWAGNRPEATANRLSQIAWCFELLKYKYTNCSAQDCGISSALAIQYICIAVAYVLTLWSIIQRTAGAPLLAQPNKSNNKRVSWQTQTILYFLIINTYFHTHVIFRFTDSFMDIIHQMDYALSLNRNRREISFWKIMGPENIVFRLLIR